MKSARFWLAAVLLLILSAGVAVGQNATVAGLVIDRSNGEPLAAVNVAMQDAEGRLVGTTTTADGYFLLTGVPPGRHILFASFLGYETHRDTLDLVSGQRMTLTIELEPTSFSFDEVVITAEGQGQSVGAAGLQTITPKQIEMAPMPDISGDLIAYLQVLPGMMSPGDRGGQLFVRGGTPAQNLILLDGMPLFQPFHIIGFFSAFPSDIIRAANIHAGGFGAKYGGRLSSVLDISTRNGNKQRFEGAVSAGTFLTSILAEGPLEKGRTSFLASIRESLIAETLPDGFVGDLPFRFGDEFFKVHSNLPDGSQLSVTVVNSHDRGLVDATESLKSDDLSDLLNVQTNPVTDEIKWQNTAVGFRLVSLPEVTPVFGELTGSVTRFVNEFGNDQEPGRRSTVFVTRAATALTHKIDQNELSWGASLELVDVNYDLNGLFQEVDASGDAFIEVGPFAEFLYRPSGQFSFTPGLHAFVIAGTRQAILLEPRLRASWYPAGFAAGHELSAAAGLYHQNLVGLRDERDAGDVFTAWTFSDRSSNVPSAFHALLGWRSQISNWLEFGIEGYYKALEDLSVPEWLAYPRFTTTLQPADGEVLGLDTRVFANFGSVDLFIGYGLQWVEYTASQESFGIWYGTEQEAYHPPHDRRHQLNLVAGMPLFGMADLDIRWEFGSGLPYTRPYGFDDWIFFETLPDLTSEPGEYRVSFQRPYQGRLPTYHRLDVSLKRAFDFDSARLTLQAGLFNAYDRANLFYFDVWTLNRVDQMSLVPSFGIKLETR